MLTFFQVAIASPEQILAEFPAWTIDDMDNTDPDRSVPFHTTPAGEKQESTNTVDVLSCGPDDFTANWLVPGAIDLSPWAIDGIEVWVVTTARIGHRMERSAFGPFVGANSSLDMATLVPQDLTTLSTRLLVKRDGETIGTHALPRLVMTNRGLVDERDLANNVVVLKDGATYVSTDR